MSLTCGSVGDIIAVCLLVKQLIEALDDCRGSSTEYQAVKRELLLLERTLWEVEKASRTFGNRPELNAICETARRAVESCKASMEAFSSRLKKYKSTLGSRIPVKPVTAAAMKVRWQVSEKEQLGRFRAEVAAHQSSISTLLNIAGMYGSS